MRYVGIDAGSRKAGLCLFTQEPGQLLRLDYVSHIRMDTAAWKEVDLSHRLFQLHESVYIELGILEPDLVVLEHIIVRGGGKNLDAYLTSGRAQEAVELAAMRLGIPVVGMPASVARSRLGITAKKGEIKAAVLRKVNALHREALERLDMYPLIGVQEDVADATILGMMGPTLAKKHRLRKG